MNTSDQHIGQVAEQLGVSVPSLRRWEAAGFLPFATRRSTLGWRLYDVDEIEKLRAFCAERRYAIKGTHERK